MSQFALSSVLGRSSVLRLLCEGWHCAVFAWTQDALRRQQNLVCNTFKIARVCPVLVSEQNFSEPPSFARFHWSISPKTMPGFSQLDSQHCGLCAVRSIDAFAQTSNDSDIKALVGCGRQSFSLWQLRLNTEDLQARTSELREASEISAQNAARQAQQGPIQRMPSRALNGSHGQRSCIVFPLVQHHCVMFGINTTVVPTNCSLFSSLALDLSHFSNASVSKRDRDEKRYVQGVQ